MADAHTKFIFDWLRQVHGDRTEHGEHKITGGSLRIAFALSQYMNRKTGDAWPSQERLSIDTNMTKRGVQKYLFKLRECGHLLIEERHGPGTTNRYRPVLRKTNHRASLEADNDEPQGAIEDGKWRTVVPEMTNHRASQRRTTVRIEPLEEPSEEQSEKNKYQKRLEEFEETYPGNIEHPDCHLALQKAFRLGASFEEIMVGARREAASECPSTLSGAEWLDARGWLNHPAPPAPEIENPSPAVAIGVRPAP